MKNQLLAALTILSLLSGCAPVASKNSESMGSADVFRSIENTEVEIQSKEADILFVGDIMMGRYVRSLMDKNGKNYPFAKLPEDFFSGFDMVLANLEGPITKRFVTGGTSMVFGFPVDTATILKNQGITAVSLGNNHTLNKGLEGFEETKTYLTEAGIEFFGRQNGEDIETSVLNKEIDGLKISFISLHDAERDIDQNTALDMIKELDSKSDYIFVMPHWGVEYQHKANKRQTTLAHEWIDAGADVIIGHHSHVVQNAEIYQGKPIFYSLGNFIFDQYFSTDTQEELSIKLAIKDKQLTFKLVPLKSTRSQSYVMDEVQKAEFLKKFNVWSGWVDGQNVDEYGVMQLSF